MAYGLTATTANDTFIIDGSSSTYRGLQVSSFSTGTFSQVSAAGGDIVFANRSSAAGSGLLSGNIPATNTLNGDTSFFIVSLSNNNTAFGGAPSAGEYGLQVYNQGNQVAYDSRLSSNGFSIEKVFPAGTINGQRSGYTSQAGNVSGDILHTGSDIGDYYLMMNGSLLYSLGSTASTVLAAAYYQYSGSTSKLYFVNYVQYTDLGGNTNYLGLPNLGTVILAKYIP